MVVSAEEYKSQMNGRIPPLLTIGASGTGKTTDHHQGQLQSLGFRSLFSGWLKPEYDLNKHSHKDNPFLVLITEHPYF